MNADDFSNSTESTERLRALRERAERFENLADDMAAQSQKDRLIMGEMIEALEHAQDLLKAFGSPIPETIRATIARAKTILE